MTDSVRFGARKRPVDKKTSLGRKEREVVNGRMGLHWCMPYAEAFQTYYPHGHSHLPLNEHLLKLSTTPASEHYWDLRIMVK